MGFYSTYCYELVSGNSPETELRKIVILGEIKAGYTYEKETETIVLDCRSVKPINGETIPKTLTLDRAGTVAQTPEKRWVADELDLYLDAYSDVDVYMKGEITLDGKTYPVYAFETGNSDYYELYVNNSATYAVSMVFRFFDDRIEAIRNEGGVMMEYWDPTLTRVTFHPAPIE